MNRDENIRFINSKLEDSVREVVSAANLLGDGMEFYAVNDYLIQSLFLKLTGAQEQKMKCICWELATDNLSYRYKRYYEKWSLSQCSSYYDKTVVYEDIIKNIKRHDPNYALFTDPSGNDKKLVLNHILDVMNNIFLNTNIERIHRKKYNEFVSVWNNIIPACLAPTTKWLFKNGNREAPLEGLKRDEELYAIYFLLYNYRNRYAHNATSYQLNLPRFYEINDDIYQTFNNVFIFIAELILIDDIFRTLFSAYKASIQLD